MTDENEFPVPLSWREHFGEEAFYDIFVYTHYGNRTPEEAVVLLGLKPCPPPEKRMESKAKQEDSKPIVEVATPEIKEDNKFKEVKGMENQQKNEEEKTKKNFFPNTTKQEQERASGEFFPSMKGIPETIEIPTESSFKGGGSGRASMKIDEFPGFLQDRLETAHRWGDLSKTLRYYISVGDGGQIFDRRTIGDLKRLGKDYDDAKTLDERKSVFKEISEYLRGMKAQRR